MALSGHLGSSRPLSDHLRSCWPSGLGSTNRCGSFKLDTGSVKCKATTKQWVTTVEDCGYKLPGEPLPLVV